MMVLSLENIHCVFAYIDDNLIVTKATNQEQSNKVTDVIKDNIARDKFIAESKNNTGASNVSAISKAQKA